MNEEHAKPLLWGAVILGAWWFIVRPLTSRLAQPGALNPASANNIVYSLGNVTDKSGQVVSTLGTRLWEWLHPAEVARELEATASVPYYLNPATLPAREVKRAPAADFTLNAWLSGATN